MDTLILPTRLRDAKRVIVAGAGGGYDVYAGLPLYLALRREGKEAFFANLSFTNLARTDARRLTPVCATIEAATQGSDAYFPERCLARFLSQRGDPNPVVYAFEKTGVAPIREGYAELVRHLDADAIVLVDGGTDILMRGDEAGLGTPAEDMVSLGAVDALGDVATRLVACVGFGIDAFHGVCHAHYLENVAALSAEGAFLGATALLHSMPEVAAYVDAVEHAESLASERPSIVNGSIVSAIEGRFGDHQRTTRTNGSTLFINPLMTLLWCFDLPAVARRSLYLERLRETQSIWDVQVAIEAFRHNVSLRPRQPIPH